MNSLVSRYAAAQLVILSVLCIICANPIFANTNTATSGAGIAAPNSPSDDLLAKDVLKESVRKDLSLWVANAIQVLLVLVSSANLALVAWLFRKANAYHDRERAQDHEDRQRNLKLEVTNFWLQELILKPSNEFIHDFFNKYETELIEVPKTIQSKMGNVDEARKVSVDSLIEFKKQFHQMNRRLIDPLIFVSDEFKNLQPIMREIEDLVTAEFDTVRLGVKASNGNDTPDIKFRDCRQRFFLTLHLVHKKLIGLE